MMTFEDYQIAAAKFNIVDQDKRLVYATWGLMNEYGEFLGKMKKALRGDPNVVNKEDLEKEMGDVLWYLSATCDSLDIDLQVVAETNLVKLQDRKDRGVIRGDGDDR